MDEFRLYGSFQDQPLLKKYSGQSGRIETRVLDLGVGSNRVVRIDALGGRTSNTGRLRNPDSRNAANKAVILTGGAEAIFVAPSSEYSGSGQFNFSDDSAIRFFFRISDSPYLGNETGWQPFRPGTEFSGVFQGRFIQLAAEFYPSGDGETTPYLEELRILYAPDDPPNPPAMVTAIARDGAVDLSWRGSPNQDVEGYMVYYGTSRGEFFGDDAILGPSPINVGKRTAIHIDGLKNGVLYYFAIAAYDRLIPLHMGEFSRDVTARPLRSVE
jgi:hypothetical protein